MGSTTRRLAAGGQALVPARGVPRLRKGTFAPPGAAKTVILSVDLADSPRTVLASSA